MYTLLSILRYLMKLKSKHIALRLVHQLLPILGAFVMQLALAQGGIQVSIRAVQVESVGTGFELDGVIQPVKQSIISAQAGGRVASFLVKAGDKVKAGQVLASIDDREAQTGVQRAEDHARRPAAL